MEFDPFDLSVKDLSTWNVNTRCNNSGPLYTMRLPSHPASSSHVVAPLTLVASASTWHRRLSHPGVDILLKLSHDSSVICSRRTHDLCHACQLGHHTHLPFIILNSHAYNNFDLIYCDLWTSPIVSISSYKYYLVILDDHSILCGLFLCMLNLTHFLLCQFFLLMSRYNSSSLAFFANKGVILRMSCPYISS
jgi:hypothetical protein